MIGLMMTNRAASIGGLIFFGALVSGYQLSKVQLQPGEHSALGARLIIAQKPPVHPSAGVDARSIRNRFLLL